LYTRIQLLVQYSDAAADRRLGSDGTDNRVTGRQQCRCIVPKAVYAVESAPEDGRIYRPKHVGLI
jgi:hypothetical protein